MAANLSGNGSFRFVPLCFLKGFLHIHKTQKLESERMEGGTGLINWVDVIYTVMFFTIVVFIFSLVKKKMSR